MASSSADEAEQSFKNPKGPLLPLLRETGPVPGDENGAKKRGGAGDETSGKKNKKEKIVSTPSSCMFLFLLGGAHELTAACQGRHGQARGGPPEARRG